RWGGLTRRLLRPSGPLRPPNRFAANGCRNCRRNWPVTKRDSPGGLSLPDHRARTGLDFAELPMCQAGVGQHRGDGRFVIRTDDQRQANAHVEDTLHLFFFDAAEALEPGEDGRDGPTAFFQDGLYTLGQDTFEVVAQAAAGDVGDAVD